MTAGDVPRKSPEELALHAWHVQIPVQIRWRKRDQIIEAACSSRVERNSWASWCALRREWLSRRKMQLSSEQSGRFRARREHWSMRVRSITVPLTHTVMRICAIGYGAQLQIRSQRAAKDNKTPCELRRRNHIDDN